MVDKFLPTISSLVALGEFVPTAQFIGTSQEEDAPTGLPCPRQAQRAEDEWQGAIEALGQLLQQSLDCSSGKDGLAATSGPSQTTNQTLEWGPNLDDSLQGVMLSGPFPVLDFPELTTHLSNWTFIPQPLAQLSLTFAQLMPADSAPPLAATPAARLLTLLEGDPLVAERFCLLLTQQFSLVLVLGKDTNEDLHFQFSFTPQVITDVWQLLRSRIVLTQPQQLEFLDPLVKKFAPVSPDYRLVSQFSRYLISALSESRAQTQHESPAANPHHIERTTPSTDVSFAVSQVGAVQRRSDTAGRRTSDPDKASDEDQPSSDGELLKAMAHEIRTPLTTIRTFTRSLLRRKNLDANVSKRLQQIDRECTQQIDRFNLIFKAVELEAASHKVPRSPLTATSLSDVFKASIPQWQQAATRRNLMLEVSVPSKLPMVASDPAMLQQVLTGLVELFTHSVSPGSHIDLQVIAAGHQLKLQFQPHLEQSADQGRCQVPTLKSLGHLLMFQPDTGGLSLNLAATKALFQALGAKLIVRERPSQGATWTVFLPIETADYPMV